MLQKILWVLLFLVVAVCILFFFRGKASQNGSAPGLSNGQLAQCSKKPNCVCSEYSADAEHFVPAFDFGAMLASDVWAKVQPAIEATGGTVVSIDDTYLVATYTSGIFKFVDDVELRLDADAHVIHVRSASREGYSDLGANARRVAAIKKAIGL